MNLNLQSKSPEMKVARSECDIQLLLPFDELVSVKEEGDDLCKQLDNYRNTTMEDCSLPDPCTLMHVTNRRKLPPKPPEKKNSAVVCDISFSIDDIVVNIELTNSNISG